MAPAETELLISVKLAKETAQRLQLPKIDLFVSFCSQTRCSQSCERQRSLFGSYAKGNTPVGFTPFHSEKIRLVRSVFQHKPRGASFLRKTVHTEILSARSTRVCISQSQGQMQTERGQGAVQLPCTEHNRNYTTVLTENAGQSSW